MNFDGKKEWGNIFPDGKVPIMSIGTQKAKLEGTKDAESVFTIDWKELTTEQQLSILEKLSCKNGIAKEAILKNISKTGLPLRRNLISSCGTNRMELYF